MAGVPTYYRFDSTANIWEYTLYEPTYPESGGKPRLFSLEMYLDGAKMVSKPRWQDCTSNIDFWVEIDHAGPESATNPIGPTYGAIYVGFKAGFDPRSHLIEYRYEEICHCVDVGEELYQPISRCTTCYGTGFVGGYDQYICGEEWEGNIMYAPANTILCRFPITEEAVKISKYGGEIVTRRKSWTRANPVLRDWDILIRTRAMGAPININPEDLSIADERYFVTDIEYSTARASYDLPQKAQPDFPAYPKAITMHQKFSSVEIQPQHIAYQVPFVTI